MGGVAGWRKRNSRWASWELGRGWAGGPSACQVLLGELLVDRERHPEDRYLRGDGREGEAVGQVAESRVPKLDPPPWRLVFFVPNQRDLGGASAPLGGAS